MLREMNPNVAIAYRYLLKGIMSFEFEPGRAIVDSQIAKQLDMSRAPVREAVLQLVTDGMVQSVDGRMTVTPINIDDIVDIIHVRSALETECFRMIDQNGWLTPEQEETLVRIHRQMSESSDTDSISEHYKYDDAFHAEIVNAAHSPRFTAITEQMRMQMQRARWLTITIPSRRQESAREHQAILDAILRHSLSDAQDAMRLHLVNCQCAFRRVLDSKQTKQMVKAIGCFLD